MKIEELALCTREEFEQQLNKMCPDSKCKNPGDDLDGMNRGALKKAATRQHGRRTRLHRRHSCQLPSRITFIPQILAGVRKNV